MIIGISGHKTSGKSTAAIILQYLASKSTDNFLDFANKNEQIRNEISGLKIKLFAYKLKQIVSLLIGCSMEDLENGEFKETYLDDKWTIFKNDCEEKLSPRILLQKIGTDLFREQIHPDIWVNALFSDFNEKCNWIISDTRFLNEAEMIKKNNGIIIRINRVEADNKSDLHKSETELDNYNFDYVIDNNGSMAELIKKIKKLNII